jgi:hypothetical protein
MGLLGLSHRCARGEPSSELGIRRWRRAGADVPAVHSCDRRPTASKWRRRATSAAHVASARKRKDVTPDVAVVVKTDGEFTALRSSVLLAVHAIVLLSFSREQRFKPR